MARLTQAESREQTRRRLLDAARREFGARGFGAATLDQIAETAGLTRGALYYNFPGGKEDLFLALLEERIDARAKATAGFFEPAADAAALRAQARAAAAEAADAQRENREWQLLFFEFALHAARDERFARELAARESRIRASLSELIERQAEAFGGEPPLPPAHVARALNALGNGLMLDQLVDPDGLPDGLFERIVGVLTTGLIAEATGAPRDRRAT
jgi:AcrR family transcriptional regulator